MGSPTPIDANAQLIVRLSDAPGQIQPIMTTLARDCTPELHEGNLFVTVPFDTVQKAVHQARSIHRQDVLASVLILSMTMAATVVGVLLFIK